MLEDLVQFYETWYQNSFKKTGHNESLNKKTRVKKKHLTRKIHLGIIRTQERGTNVVVICVSSGRKCEKVWVHKYYTNACKYENKSRA